MGYYQLVRRPWTADTTTYSKAHVGTREHWLTACSVTKLSKFPNTSYEANAFVYDFISFCADALSPFFVRFGLNFLFYGAKIENYFFKNDIFGVPDRFSRVLTLSCAYLRYLDPKFLSKSRKKVAIIPKSSRCSCRSQHQSLKKAHLFCLPYGAIQGKQKPKPPCSR